eukprot:2981220-Pyramimonas_sp.AAC.1
MSLSQEQERADMALTVDASVLRADARAVRIPPPGFQPRADPPPPPPSCPEGHAFPHVCRRLLDNGTARNAGFHAREGLTAPVSHTRSSTPGAVAPAHAAAASKMQT